MDYRIPESFKILGINLNISTGSQLEKQKPLAIFSSVELCRVLFDDYFGNKDFKI